MNEEDDKLGMQIEEELRRDGDKRRTEERLLNFGIEAFQRKEYVVAERWFSAGLCVNEMNASLYSNRSATFIRLNKPKLAMEDARICIKLKPNWSKGYYRLGTSLIELGEISKAYKAMCLAFAMEPTCQLYMDMKNSLRMEIIEKSSESSIHELENEIAHLLPKQVGIEMGNAGLVYNPPKSIPVTILSGFLGAGKTTLVKNIMMNHDNMKIALIVNDMSHINIDVEILKQHQISITASSEEVVELSNGCICCTLREDLLNEIIRLAETGNFNYILIESTGISEPIPVAQTFLLDNIQGKWLNQLAHIDTMVTVVNANSFLDDLGSQENLIDRSWQSSENDRRSIANLLVDQIEFADVIVVNKMDLATPRGPNYIDKVIKTINLLNPNAEIIESSFSNINLNQILGANRFDMHKASQNLNWMKELRERHIPETEEYGIHSWVFKYDIPFDIFKLSKLMKDSSFLYDECHVIRSKGMTWVRQDSSLIIEWSSAGKQIDCKACGFWPEFITTEPKLQVDDRIRTQLVFIGIGIEINKLNQRLIDCTLSSNIDQDMEQNIKFIPIVSDMYESLDVLNFDHRKTLTRDQANKVIHLSKQSSKTRNSWKRYFEVRTSLSHFENQVDELNGDHLEQIDGLSTEYIKLMEELNLSSENTVQSLYKLKREIADAK